MTVLAVVGGQYGSEGKGKVVSYLADEFAWHVRSGGPNAGHTHYLPNGTKWVNQQVPVGWVNRAAQLVLTPGALISLDTLSRELRDIARYQDSDAIYSRVLVDSNAGIISRTHHNEAGGVHGEAHQRYGSTGEGVGVARVARLSRDPARFERFRDWVARERDSSADEVELRWLESLQAENTSGLLTQAAKAGVMVLLEGTQGYGLSLIHGPWPYTTNHDTNAAQMAADAGLAPRLVDTVMLVFRTFPIRVAGNSGPLPGEVTWQDMRLITGQPDLIENTTVTKKPRRIGFWDWELAEKAVQVNQPDGIALTFLDYYDRNAAGQTDWNELCRTTTNGVQFVNEIERRLGVPVWLIGTGPQTMIDRRPNLAPHWNVPSWYKRVFAEQVGSFVTKWPTSGDASVARLTED